MTKTNKLALICALLGSAGALAATESSASATTTTDVSPAPAAAAGGGTTFAKPARLHLLLADNVVVSPSNPAPQPAPVVVQPGEPTSAQQPVVVHPEARRKEVVQTQAPDHNYMGTIALSALMGGVTGALIGGASCCLGNQDHPYNTAYWAAGGVLVGTGVGVVQLAVQESRVSEATALRKLPTDPAPTFRLALFKTHF